MAKTLGEFKAKHNPQTIIARLEADLVEARNRATLEDSIREIIGTATLALGKLDAPEWTSRVSRDVQHGVPSLLLSDFHWGERVSRDQVGGVNEYNLAIARQRLKRTTQTALDLCRMLDAKMRYPGIVVLLAGDMVSGSLHEELARSNESQEMKVVLDLVDNLGPAIKFLADSFGNVFLPCVSGNHGRNTRKTWAKDRNATSFDWLAYQFLARQFISDPRVTFHIPEGQDASYKIYNTRYLLTHGDTLGHGGDGLIGFLGPVMRGDHKRRTRQQQIARPYDTLCCGHWHSYNHSQRAIVNGSLKGYCEFAYTESFPFELPQQAMWITHPTNGITWRAPILCEKSAKQGSGAAWAEAAG
jgi:hypothetical protein